jgi:hypothetical protein
VFSVVPPEMFKGWFGFPVILVKPDNLNNNNEHTNDNNVGNVTDIVQMMLMIFEQNDIPEFKIRKAAQLAFQCIKMRILDRCTCNT